MLARMRLYGSYRSSSTEVREGYPETVGAAPQGTPTTRQRKDAVLVITSHSTNAVMPAIKPHAEYKALELAVPSKVLHRDMFQRCKTPVAPTGKCTACRPMPARPDRILSAFTDPKVMAERKAHSTSLRWSYHHCHLKVQILTTSHSGQLHGYATT